jgi:catechol 2,3-dioxygenase-like lactoylglutathione lyase family enzyme
MRDKIEILLKEYEVGQVSRRVFVQSLAALVTAPTSPLAQTQKPIFRTINLNHVALATNDLNRTQEFYQRVFGMPAFGRDENGLFLRVGERCIGVDLASKAKENIGIDHFCIGIEGFDRERARKTLAAQSIETFTELGTGVFFRDPDGNKVQVSAPNYPD